MENFDPDRPYPERAKDKKKEFNKKKEFTRKTTPLVHLIRRSDYILEIVDARYPEWSRNVKLERLILKEGRRFILIFNKIDLIPRENIKPLRQKYKGSFFVAAPMKYGLSELRKFLKIESKNKEIAVGIVGYPNTGKSSIINALKGRHSAPTSPVAGFTRGVIKIRISPNVLLWDTPGVVPFGEDELRLVLLGSKNPEQLQDPESIALNIISKVLTEGPGVIKARYKVSEAAEPMEILEKIAIHSGSIKKGGIPDTQRAAKTVIHDWQKDKLRVW